MRHFGWNVAHHLVGLALVPDRSLLPRMPANDKHFYGSATMNKYASATHQNKHRHKHVPSQLLEISRHNTWRPRAHFRIALAAPRSQPSVLSPGVASISSPRSLTGRSAAAVSGPPPLRERRPPPSTMSGACYRTPVQLSAGAGGGGRAGRSVAPAATPRLPGAGSVYTDLGRGQTRRRLSSDGG